MPTPFQISLTFEDHTCDVTTRVSSTSAHKHLPGMLAAGSNKHASLLPSKDLLFRPRTVTSFDPHQSCINLSVDLCYKTL